MEIGSICHLGHHASRMEVGTRFTGTIAALTTVIHDRRSMTFSVNGTAYLLLLGRSFFIWRALPIDPFLLRFRKTKFTSGQIDVIRLSGSNVWLARVFQDLNRFWNLENKKLGLR